MKSLTSCLQKAARKKAARAARSTLQRHAPELMPLCPPCSYLYVLRHPLRAFYAILFYYSLRLSWHLFLRLLHK